MEPSSTYPDASANDGAAIHQDQDQVVQPPLPATIYEDEDHSDEEETLEFFHQPLEPEAQMANEMSQQLAAAEFMSAPSEDRWLDLVETMRLERELQMIEFYKSQNGGVLPEGFVVGGCGSPPRGGGDGDSATSTVGSRSPGEYFGRIPGTPRRHKRHGGSSRSPRNHNNSPRHRNSPRSGGSRSSRKRSSSSRSPRHRDGRSKRYDTLLHIDTNTIIAPPQQHRYKYQGPPILTDHSPRDHEEFNAMLNNNTTYKPDPPTLNHHEKYTDDDDYYMDDMGGWGMGATPNAKQQRRQQRNPTTIRHHHHHHHQLEEDDIVSNQLKGMLRHKSTLVLSDHDTMTMTDEEEGGRGFITSGGNHNEHQGDDSHHRSYRCTLIQKHLRKFNNNTACIFLLGFILGTIVIVGLSITFDKTPSEEMNALRKHGAYSDNFEGKVHLGDSMDINAIDQDDIDEGEGEDESETTKTLEVINEAKEEEQTEEEHDFTNFCKKCQWKNSVFDCAQRVRWEMKQYNMSEHEAMMTNVDHCTSPGGVPPPNEKTLEEKEEENEIKMEEELEKEEMESAAASP